MSRYRRVPIKAKPRHHDFRVADKYIACDLCGTTIKRLDLEFDSGSVEPTADETLTGATSGATGVVVEDIVYSGSYAGGDATGVVVLKNYTGLDFDTGSAFTEDELVNGSVGGSNIMTAIRGAEKIHNGRMWPLSQTAVLNGRRLCMDHYRWRVMSDEEDKIRIYIDEEDRGREDGA